MNAYKYQPLDEQWLTEIPEHWESRKIKYAFSERTEKGYPNEPLLVASQNMGVVPKGVYGNRTVEATKDLHNLKLVRVGDFVISLRSFQGGLEYAYYKGIISPAYTVMIPNDCISSGYFRFLAKSRLFIELLQLCVTGIREGQNIDYGKLKNHLIPLPPREEQDQIVRYLDWKVSLINKLINAKRRQIALLQEQKQAVINEAVTKGGEGWKRMHLKRVCRFKTGTTPSGNEGINNNNEGFCWYTPSDFRNTFYLKPADKHINEDIVKTNNIVLYDAGSVLFIGIGGTTGKVAYCKERAYSNQQITAIMPKGITSLYLLYFMIAKSQFIKETANYTTLPIVNNAQLSAVELFVPPIKEQIEIVDYLENKCSKIDRAVEKIEEQISLFTEYRTRLISDVVTGKLDVRGVVVPEYEAVEEAVDIALSEDDEIETVADEETTPETLVAKHHETTAKPKGHNQHFDDAVMIAAIVDAFYHDKYPLGRKKTQKLLYLLRRHQEESTSAFKKKAAGPYADEIRYKGGEPIAVSNKYIKTTSASGKGTTFSMGANLSQALDYVQRWGISSDIQWLVDKFCFTSVDILELYATVDMAICDLTETNIPVSLATIKHLIETNAEWKAKLKKQTFSDEMINKAIVDLAALI